MDYIVFFGALIGSMIAFGYAWLLTYLAFRELGKFIRRQFCRASRVG